jgi:DNA methylase
MRHPLHAICPYFAMFPEEFVARQLFAFTRPGDLVLDPFSGRGTTILESRLNRRRAIGTDTNAVAACVSGAKAQLPTKRQVENRLVDLQRQFSKYRPKNLPNTAFFDLCFHKLTLRELCFLRETLSWKTNRVDCFLAAVALGALHGESHKSPNYFSNRMPRTISTKPDYSVRWWRERNLVPDRRNVFSILATLVDYRLSAPVPKSMACVKNVDARSCGKVFKKHKGEVSLIVTSPPYLDTTDYSEDQWLRLWFLGGEVAPKRNLQIDDRHTIRTNYWNFLREVWEGCSDLLAKDGVLVIRIGGSKLSELELSEGVIESVRLGFGRKIRSLRLPQSSEIRKSQVNSFRPGTVGKSKEHDFIFRIR